MQDLGVDQVEIQAWFRDRVDGPYVLVRVSAEAVGQWARALAVPLRRCYLTDAVLSTNALARGESEEAVIATVLPDPGAVMAGDFGEILVYLYQGTMEPQETRLGATKWRLKQDRTKPAPRSDVVHLVLPMWPAASEQDAVICSEVKTKSTAGTSSPILDSIADCQKDRTSRLAKTLVWLQERAMTTDLGDLQLDHLRRFTQASEHPPAQRRFSAVSVVSAELLAGELANAPTEVHPEYSVVVIAVPDLYTAYHRVFDAARTAIVTAAPGQVA